MSSENAGVETRRSKRDRIQRSEMAENAGGADSQAAGAQAAGAPASSAVTVASSVASSVASASPPKRRRAESLHQTAAASTTPSRARIFDWMFGSPVEDPPISAPSNRQPHLVENDDGPTGEVSFEEKEDEDVLSAITGAF